jgi:ribosomal-protein-alanine N-acetyltransferase
MATILTEHLELMIQSPDDVRASIDAMSPADRAEISSEWLARVNASTEADPWLHGFTMVDRASGDVVGRCGYKGPAGQDSIVEIAYGVESAYRQRGYATEAARALLDFAFRSGVALVRAHTLPAESASTRVLTKCGFERVGEVVDPEDGLVWRWERQRR